MTGEEIVREPNGRRSRATVKAPGSGPGRPSHMTPAVRAKILESLRAGVRLEAAAALGGVTGRTFREWMFEGRKPEGRALYRQFAEQVDEALATWEATKTLQISRAGDKEWQANAWLLERRLPEQYGRRTRVDGQLTVTARPFIDVAKLSLEEQETLLALLRKAQPDEGELPPEGRGALELLPGPPVVA